ncbi:10856_t:CDS:2, partial [Ambispora gerdemannii]
LATYLAEVQEADFAVTIAEPHETFHELLEIATGVPHDEDQNIFTQSTKVRIKNSTAIVLAFQSLHKRITSSKVKLRYLKRNFVRRNLLTEKAFLKSEKAPIQLLSPFPDYLKNQARAENLLPNVIRKHEKTEVRDANTDYLICAVYQNHISKETLDFMFESVLLMFQECSKLREQPKVLASFLKAEKQKKKTINEEKGEAANKESGEAIGKDVINSEKNEIAEVKGETAEMEDEFDKEESVIESKEDEVTNEDDKKESKAEDV